MVTTRPVVGLLSLSLATASASQSPPTGPDLLKILSLREQTPTRLASGEGVGVRGFLGPPIVRANVSD